MLMSLEKQNLVMELTNTGLLSNHSKATALKIELDQKQDHRLPEERPPPPHIYTADSTKVQSNSLGMR